MDQLVRMDAKNINSNNKKKIYLLISNNNHQFINKLKYLSIKNLKISTWKPESTVIEGIKKE